MYLIFDFDGTLIDSFKGAIDIFNGLAEEFNLRKVKASETALIRDLNSNELVKFLQIPLYKLPLVIYRAQKKIRNDLLDLTPFTNLPDVLRKLHKAGWSLGILSSNSSENVSDWLTHHNIKHLFSFLHSESSYFGKNRILKKLLKLHNIDKSRVYYFGDETRDIEAAKFNNIFAVGVTWGFNSATALKQCQPHFIANQPEDILAICNVT